MALMPISGNIRRMVLLSRFSMVLLLQVVFYRLLNGLFDGNRICPYNINTLKHECFLLEGMLLGKSGKE